MSSFNQRIHEIKIRNYYTEPVNEARFDNPYLLKSDTQALNDILAHLQTPLPAPVQAPAQAPAPANILPGLVPTDSTPTPLSGLVPTDSTPNPQDADTEERDQNVDHQADSGSTNQDNGNPLPTSGAGNAIPSREGDTTDLYDDESGEENNPYNPQDDMNLDEGMDEEGHSEIVPAQATTTDGSTVSSGPGLIVDGKINRALGLPETLRTQLTSSNGKPLKRVMFNPTTGKYTLYYGTRLASGRYPGRVELSAPPPPAQEPSWLEAAGLAYYQATLDPRSGANYMLDRIAGPGAHRNRFGRSAPP